MVARGTGEVAAHGEIGVERQPRLNRIPRLVHPIEMGRCRREQKVSIGIVPVQRDRATEPFDGLLIIAEEELGVTGDRHPRGDE